MNNKKINVVITIFGILAVLIGILLIVWQNKILDSTNNKKSYYILSDAIVISYEKSYDSDNHTSYGIIAEYKVDGKKYKIYPNTYVDRKSKLKKIGDIVKIRYNPNLPSEAIWENDKTSFVLLIFGMIFIIVGVFLITLSLLQKKDKQHMLNKEIKGKLAGAIVVPFILLFIGSFIMLFFL